VVIFINLFIHCPYIISPTTIKKLSKHTKSCRASDKYCRSCVEKIWNGSGKT
jgi:hypothetical protein